MAKKRITHTADYDLQQFLSFTSLHEKAEQQTHREYVVDYIGNRHIIKNYHTVHLNSASQNKERLFGKENCEHGIISYYFSAKHLETYSIVYKWSERTSVTIVYQL